MGLMANNLTFSFGQGSNRRHIFDDREFSFPRGSFTCVRGPSGSGKTTLLTLLSLIEQPHGGDITFDGISLISLMPAEASEFRNKKIGLVFQTLRLIEVLTVREHFRIVGEIKGVPDALTIGSELLAQFGLKGILSALPKELSGGEKQRVALAQALSVAPSIILADEPTAALDPENSLIIANALRNYAEQGNVVICVTHDDEVAQSAHHILELSKG